MNLYNCVLLLTATTEASTGHVYPDGSVTTPDLSVSGGAGSGVFDWFGMLINWLNTTRVPLPGAYNVTFMQAMLFGIALFILGKFLFGLIDIGSD